MIDTAELVASLAEFLPRQRWYGSSHAPGSLEIVTRTELRAPWPALEWVVVSADGVSYSLVVGVRTPDEIALLHGHDDAIVGKVATDAGDAIAYDATIDPVLALWLLERIAPEETVTRVRPMGAEQSNTSLVYDDRLIFKLYRRFGEGSNPEVEVTVALAEQGFDHVVAPVAIWREHGLDLGLVQPYLIGATEGWADALTSLRDLYGSGVASAAQAGGDFAGEAARLGQTTAQLHLALAAAFGTQPGDPNAWATDIERQVAALHDDDVDRAGAARTVDAVRGVADAGKACVPHGDYHLGQVLRADAGWFVIDFEGEPARAPGERRLPRSPLRDVAGMMRSFHYAAEVALTERDETERPALLALARSWEERNATAFRNAYTKTAGIETLLPRDEISTAVLLKGFLVEKAAYEIAYERAHRPDWVGIPQAALARLLHG